MIWARLMAEGKAAGRPRSAIDMMIAAVAEANGRVIVSDNEMDFAPAMADCRGLWPYRAGRRHRSKRPSDETEQGAANKEAGPHIAELVAAAKTTPAELTRHLMVLRMIATERRQIIPAEASADLHRLLTFNGAEMPKLDREPTWASGLAVVNPMRGNG